MDDDEVILSTPEEISAMAEAVKENLLPTKSRRLYEKSYEKFMSWRSEYKTTSFSENVLLAYFNSLIGTLKPSSMWVEYSKLKSMLNIHHRTDISQYAKLIAFLKRKSEGYKAKKAHTFSPDDLQKFIDNAPDYTYLLSKVAVILGIMGACRRQELHMLKIDHILDADNTLVVNIMNTKNRIDRTFTITGKYYKLVKKYMNLRPNTCTSQNFFVRYISGKCVAQNIGINAFGQMGKTMAAYLNLPNPELYTGHCFRRTSATLLVDAGGNIMDLKRHGGWKSTAVAEGYVDNSIQNKKKVSNLLMNSIEKTQPHNATTTYIPETELVPVIPAPESHQKNITPTLLPSETEPTQTPLLSQIQQDSDIPINTAASRNGNITPTPLPSDTETAQTPSLSQIIQQNSDIRINTAASRNGQTITISHNTIHNLHLHFHK
ncbi:uncharacterized protein LOC125226654 isoform X1 [Leguminivora glycinivorella]|uniref:uncharacterized protein LOC125226654 isoform X1 n=1 Tax=Leguminivora glycinivorella TaxID=1035111 RepID=UPI0020109F27|nr:uncharacterized protein LOC125226654 isoform X1 [Leguminivora glycinivorella]